MTDILILILMGVTIPPIYCAVKGYHWLQFQSLFRRGHTSSLTLLEGSLTQNITEVELAPRQLPKHKDNNGNESTRDISIRAKDGFGLTVHIPSFNGFDTSRYIGKTITRNRNRSRSIRLLEDKNRKVLICGFGTIDRLLFDPHIDGCNVRTEICAPTEIMNGAAVTALLGGRLLTDQYQPADTYDCIKRVIPKNKWTVVAICKGYDEARAGARTLFIGEESYVKQRVKHNHFYLRKGRLGLAVAIFCGSLIAAKLY